jgi:hypothetical protein
MNTNNADSMAYSLLVKDQRVDERGLAHVGLADDAHLAGSHPPRLCLFGTQLKGGPCSLRVQAGRAERPRET